jgi:hypothetical protein
MCIKTWKIIVGCILALVAAACIYLPIASYVASHYSNAVPQ